MTACISVPSYSQINKNQREAIRQFDGWNWKDQNIQHMFQGVVNNSTHQAHCNGPDLHQVRSKNNNSF